MRTNAMRMAMSPEASVAVVDTPLPRFHDLDLQFDAMLNTTNFTRYAVEQLVIEGRSRRRCGAGVWRRRSTFALNNVTLPFSVLWQTKMSGLPWERMRIS